MDSSRIGDHDRIGNISYVLNMTQTLVSYYSRHHPHHMGTTLDTNLNDTENITLLYGPKARIPGKNAVLKYSLTGC